MTGPVSDAYAAEDLVFALNPHQQRLVQTEALAVQAFPIGAGVLGRCKAPGRFLNRLESRAERLVVLIQHRKKTALPGAEPPRFPAYVILKQIKKIRKDVPKAMRPGFVASQLGLQPIG